MISKDVVPAGCEAYRDEAATRLFQNLKTLGETGTFLFGQANALTHSIGGTNQNTSHDFDDTSDVKSICGYHPAFIESDIMWHKTAADRKRDVDAMREAYRRGMVVGYSWHMYGKNGGTFYYKKPNLADSNLIRDILAEPDRTKNASLDWFLTQYETKVMPLFRELGFPIVFRPFHEMNGGWFWWGKSTCTPEEFIRLYRLTVDHLRSNGIRNLLYAWAPNTPYAPEYYPGDDYVDVLGLDSYEPGVESYNPESRFVSELQAMTEYGRSHHKIVAVTETGCRKDYPSVNHDFWTERILRPVTASGNIGVSWVMTWYNADYKNKAAERTGGYVPHSHMADQPGGQAAIDDFKKFYEHPATLFEDDLAKLDLYTRGVPAAAVDSTVIEKPVGVIRLAAVDGKLSGNVKVVKSVPGYTGQGYATGFQKTGDRISWKVQAIAGTYDLQIIYSSPFDKKGYFLEVNGRKTSGMLDKTKKVFVVHRAGNVELITGENSIGIGEGRGWYDIEAVELKMTRNPNR